MVVVRTDNAREYHATETALQEVGVSMEFTSTYTPHQNGIAERFNRSMNEMMRTMLSESGLPMSFWSEAAVDNGPLLGAAELPDKALRGASGLYHLSPNLRPTSCSLCRTLQEDV